VWTGSFVSKLHALATGLQSTPRRAWWTSFVLVTSLSGLWALASAPLAGPDEPTHVIRAEALDHGEITGREPTVRLERRLRPVAGSVRVVRAPEIYRAQEDPPCFARQQGVASCLDFRGPSADVDVKTYAARQPPAYYAVVGVVSWVLPAGPITVWGMRLISAMIMGAFIATAITAVRRFVAPRLAAVGLLLATTPMVLFMGSVVNPSGPEIAASIAFWVCGLALVSRAQERVDDRLVTAVGVAGCVLALSRQLGPLWLGLIALAFVVLAGRDSLLNLARSGRAKLWAALVVVSALAQLAWDVYVRPGDPTLVSRRPTRLAVIEPLAHTGSLFRWYREMIGWFGWLDTPAPVLTWLPWTVALAFLFFLAVAWASRRHAATLLTLLGAVIVVSFVFDRLVYDGSETYWQGRYVLPLAVGIPIVAAFAIGSTARGDQLVTRRFLVTIGTMVAVAQFLAFTQNLRRFTVGYDGALQFWKNPEWLPPLPPLLLTLAFAAIVSAFAYVVLTTGPSRRTYVRPEVSARMGP
jgi:hypothetical protein